MKPQTTWTVAVSSGRIEIAVEELEITLCPAYFGQVIHRFEIGIGIGVPLRALGEIINYQGIDRGRASCGVNDLPVR